MVEISVNKNRTEADEKASMELAAKIFRETIPDNDLGATEFEAEARLEEFAAALNRAPEIEIAEINNNMDCISIVFRNGFRSGYFLTWIDRTIQDSPKDNAVPASADKPSSAALPTQPARGLKFPPFEYIGSDYISLMSPYQHEFNIGYGDVNDAVRSLFSRPPFKIKKDKKNDEVSMDVVFIL